MELENCNAHGDQENTGPNTPQNENDPSGNKKWYRQASQRLASAFFVIKFMTDIVPTKYVHIFRNDLYICKTISLTRYTLVDIYILRLVEGKRNHPLFPS